MFIQYFFLHTVWFEMAYPIKTIVIFLNSSFGVSFSRAKGPKCNRVPIYIYIYLYIGGYYMCETHNILIDRERSSVPT